MAKVQMGITVGVSVLTLAIGFLAGFRVSQIQERNAALQSLETELAVGSGMEAAAAANGDSVDIGAVTARVNDGIVEWFDGTKWHPVGSLEELQALDPFYMAQGKLEAFEQQYVEEKAAAQESYPSVQVGQKEPSKEPGNVTPPKKGNTTGTVPPASTAAPPAKTPAAPQATPVPDNDSGNSDDSGTDDNNADTTPPAEEPATPPAEEPTSPPAEEPPVEEPPTEDSSGDGENMDWSNDYL